jgi:hypothetical protein
MLRLHAGVARLQQALPLMKLMKVLLLASVRDE